MWILALGAIGAVVLILLLSLPLKKGSGPPGGMASDPAEEAVQAIEELLHDFSAQIQQRSFGGALYHVAKDFEGTAFLPDPDGETRTLNGVRVTTGPPATAASLDRPGFGSSLQPHDPAFLLIKVKSARLEEDVLKARLKVDALQIRGRRATRRAPRAEARFVKRGDRWRLREYRVTEARVEEGDLRFLDVTAASGLTAPAGYDPRPESKLFEYAYQFLGGIAAGDIDGDGDADLCVPRIGRNLFYRNEGGRFVECARALGTADPDAGSGALFLDIENDGDLDLLLTNYEPPELRDPETGALRPNVGRRAVALYRNDGRRFTDVTAAAGIEAFGPAMSACAADIDRDGDLDFYVCMYEDTGGRQSDIPLPSQVYAARDGVANLLWINQGNGTFLEDGAARGVADRGWSLAAGFADYDDDGDPDLYLANDYGDNRMYRNRGDGTFEEIAEKTGTLDTGFGMGVAWLDHDADGDLDLYVSNMYSTAGNRILEREPAGLDKAVHEKLVKMAHGNTLFRNRGDGTFENVTDSSGAGSAGWAWNAAVYDYDNNGRPDLYVSNGFRTSPFAVSDL